MSLTYIFACILDPQTSETSQGINTFTLMLDMSTLWQGLWSSWEKQNFCVFSDKTHSGLTSWPTSQLPYLKWWHNYSFTLLCVNPRFR